MNIGHRSIWNSALCAWVAVSEITRACGKRSGAAVALALIGASACSTAGAENIDGGRHVIVAPGGNPASPWIINDEIYIGHTSNGALTVQNGGTVSSTAGYLGWRSGIDGTATVTGAGSNWTTSGELVVGVGGRGTLTVSDGGTVNSADAFIGHTFSAVATAIVTGAGSTWTATHLHVGYAGQGTLTLSNGGSLVVDNGRGTIMVTDDNRSTGVVNIGGVVGSAAQAAGTVTAGDLYFGAGTGSLNFNHLDAAYTFGARIGGAGVVNQVAGTTILTGANTYTGGTTISGGTLQIGQGGTTGSITGNVVNNSALVFDRSDFSSYGGSVSGTGSLIKQGAGILALSGANTYTGGTSIMGGTLAIVADGNLGARTGILTLDGGTVRTDTSMIMDRDITLGAGNGTVDTVGSSLIALGVISGPGALTKTGIGSLTLRGANTYTGGTTVNAGTLVLGAGSSLAASGVVTLNAAGTLLDIVASGDQTLGGLAGVAGSVSLGAHTLTLDTASNQTFAGSIGGSGGLIKQGTGTQTLTGLHVYSGSTNINAGTLYLNGSLAYSAVTVNSGGTLGVGGTLGLNNTVGGLSVMSGAVLAQGNSSGTLRVAGNLSFAPGSIYRVEVDAAGNNGRVNVTGTAALNGTVNVQAGAGAYAANTTYTLLHAAGGRTGDFAGVTSNLAFLTPTLAYDANNVFLNLARNSTSFASVAVTPNQMATSTALQNAVTGASGDMSTVISTVTALSAAQARAAYDSASGAGLVALRGAGSSFAGGFGNQLQARLGAVSGGSNAVANAFSNRPVLLAANDHVSDLMAPVSDAAPQKFSLAGGSSSSASSAAASSQGRGFWLRGNGGYQHTGSDDNAAASKLRSGGLSAGFDAELREGLVLGAALSSGTSRLSFDNNDAGKSRGTALALYGSYAAGPWTFKSSASLAWNNNHMDRNVVVGAIKRTASSDFDSSTLSAYGEATYSLPMQGWTLQPLAALSLSRNKADGFTETGAGALNLQVAGQTINSTKSLLGAKAAFDAGSVRLEPRVIWAHEFGNLNTPMTAQFQGAANASPFQVSGVALKRDTLILGLGASGSIQKNFDLFADVQAEHNSRQSHLAVLAGLRARW